MSPLRRGPETAGRAPSVRRDCRRSPSVAPIGRERRNGSLVDRSAGQRVASRRSRIAARDASGARLRATSPGAAAVARLDDGLADRRIAGLVGDFRPHQDRAARGAGPPGGFARQRVPHGGGRRLDGHALPRIGRVGLVFELEAAQLQVRIDGLPAGHDLAGRAARGRQIQPRRDGVDRHFQLRFERTLGPSRCPGRPPCGCYTNTRRRAASERQTRPSRA